jgi:2'-5' RNA ligase
MARDIHDVLEQVKAPGFRLALRGIGHFGDRKHPRTLWAGVDNAEPVKFLHDRVERALTSVGLAPESRKFRPHVTLARLQGARMPAVTAFESRCNSFASEPFAVDRFVLFSSFLAGEGAIYTAEAEYPLAPSA